MREFELLNKQYKYYSKNGSYYLSQWIDNKNYNTIIVPKSDSNYCKECTDVELATYFIDRLMTNRQLKISSRDKKN